MKDNYSFKSREGFKAIILKVEKEPTKSVAGRYTIQTDTGLVIENYPGYLLKLIRRNR